MPIGIPVQHFDTTAGGAGSQGASSTCSPSTTTLATGAMAFLIAAGGANKSIASVTDDTGGNTWAIDASFSDGTRTVGIASCQILSQITTGNVVTITWSNATLATMNFSLIRVTGLASSAPFDKTAHNNGVNGAWDAGTTAALTDANEIVFGIFRGSATTGTVGAGYTPLAGSFGGGLYASEYKIVASTAAVNPQTGAATATWAGLVATYGDTPIGPVTPTAPQVLLPRSVSPRM